MSDNICTRCGQTGHRASHCHWPAGTAVEAQDRPESGEGVGSRPASTNGARAFAPRRCDSGGRMCSVTMSSTATGAKCASSCVGGCSTAGTGCVSGSPPQPGAETRSSCAVMRPSNGRAGAVGSMGTGGDQ